MRISGTAQLTAPPEAVYDSLQDGRVLAATIPGVQSLDQLSDNHYKLSIIAGVAAIKGTYEGEVVLSQQNRPESFVMTASGAGAPGTVSADVTIRLQEDDGGGTLLTYDADAVVGGMVGGVGQRMITGVAKKMAGVFFKELGNVIANGIPEAAEAVPVDAAVDGAVTVATGAPTPGAGLPASGAGLSPRPDSTGTPTDTRTLLLAVGVGAGIALTGVLLGGVLGTFRSPR